MWTIPSASGGAKEYVKVAKMAVSVGKQIIWREIPNQNTEPKVDDQSNESGKTMAGSRKPLPGSGKLATLVSMASKALRNSRSS